jgi:hypothetical protein
MARTAGEVVGLCTVKADAIMVTVHLTSDHLLARAQS